MVVAASLLSAGQSAASYYRKARKAHAKGDDATAYLLVNKAIALAPANPAYRGFSEAVSTRALSTLKVQDAIPAPAAFTVETEEPDPLGNAEWNEAEGARPPPRLLAKLGLQSFNLRGDAKELFEKVTAAYGVKVVFDGDYQATTPQHFRLEDASWPEAARALEAVTSSFLIPLNEQIALVAKDTPQKRTELEPVMSVSVPLDEPLSPQEVQETARAVQAVFEMTKMGIDNARHKVLFRDRVSRLRPALELFRQLTSHRADVVTELELLAFNEDNSLHYGISLPTSTSLTLLGNPTPFYMALPTTGSYATVGGGDGLVGVGIASSTLVATMSKSHSQSLLHAELRGIEGQPVQFHVGDRYPVQTNLYSSVSGSISSSSRVPAASMNFEDLGVVIKITPHVHGMSGVTLELEAEFKSLSGTVSNSIPIISNRKFSTKVRLDFGQTAIVSGVVQQNLTHSRSGLAAFGAIAPLTDNERGLLGQRLLLTLKPRLAGLPASETSTRALRSGSESRPLTPLE